MTPEIERANRNVAEFMTTDEQRSKCHPPECIGCTQCTKYHLSLDAQLPVLEKLKVTQSFQTWTMTNVNKHYFKIERIDYEDVRELELEGWGKTFPLASLFALEKAILEIKK